MKTGKVIVLHSYKGGTGKTTLVANLAAAYASTGYKVCLLDMDVYAPSLCSYFRKTPRAYLNDLIEGKAGIEEAIFKVSDGLNLKGELHLGLASPSKEDIQDIEIRHDQKWQLSALKQFLSIKRQLFSEHGFDFIFLDTSPGIRFWSINALAASDIMLMLMKISDMDIDGTKKMISEIYDSLTRFGSKNYLILNKVGGASPREEYNDPSSIATIEEEISRAVGMPVILSIPCYCDLQFNRHEYLSAINTPTHGFALKVKELVEKLDKF